MLLYSHSINVINGDGKDYYSYLTSFFIQHDLHQLNSKNMFVVQTPTGNINMHPSGVAVMQLPFFGIGYLWAIIQKISLSGLSWPFQKAINFSGIFYLLVGLWFTYKTLLLQGFKKIVIYSSVFSLAFGTTLLNYSINEPSMSHVYSFALLSVFVFLNQKLAIIYSNKIMYLIGLVLGFIVLVRAIDAFVLLTIPFFYNSFFEFKNRMIEILKHFKTLTLSGILMLLVISIQLIIWHAQTGEWIKNSYSDNGFYFTKPHIIEMLFSFNSGIITYTPLLLGVHIGLFFLAKQNKFKAFVLTGFIIFCLYVYSCYWAWTYFDGIGTRVLVDYYILVAILFAYLFNALKTVFTKSLVAGFSILFIAFNFIICFQYKEQIIQSTGMNFEKYKYIFLRTDKSYKGCLGGSYDIKPYTKQYKESYSKHFFDFTRNYDYSKIVTTRNNRFFNYTGNEHGIAVNNIPFDKSAKKIFLEIDFDKLEYHHQHSNGAIIAISHNDKKNKCKAFQTFKINDIPVTQTKAAWKKHQYTFSMISNFEKNDKLTVFLWNRKKEYFGIDNFKMNLYDFGISN